MVRARRRFLSPVTMATKLIFRDITILYQEQRIRETLVKPVPKNTSLEIIVVFSCFLGIA